MNIEWPSYILETLRSANVTNNAVTAVEQFFRHRSPRQLPHGETITAECGNGTRVVGRINHLGNFEVSEATVIGNGQRLRVDRFHVDIDDSYMPSPYSVNPGSQNRFLGNSDYRYHGDPYIPFDVSSKKTKPEDLYPGLIKEWGKPLFDKVAKSIDMDVLKQSELFPPINKVADIYCLFAAVIEFNTTPCKISAPVFHLDMTDYVKDTAWGFRVKQADGKTFELPIKDLVTQCHRLDGATVHMGHKLYPVFRLMGVLSAIAKAKTEPRDNSDAPAIKRKVRF